eukprot:767987-Hanusia_phi.AAC.1
MPPPRSVTCTMCGQQFFKVSAEFVLRELRSFRQASLPFHVKQCRLKTEAVRATRPASMSPSLSILDLLEGMLVPIGLRFLSDPDKLSGMSERGGIPCMISHRAERLSPRPFALC